ncbi:putative RecB family nuclease [Microbacteriaceae bacterium SG_E_30_P1]|uniref:RecB family nuclease n=1 Tax=Antiquaquibacter oligotrophicus TaxID=2880260 RepID=A0ABT6KJH0_9MICO|nr:bifunctional RecB family nuclease/DEAD/DEAH box helicase [Antiquaquibacter oligotrophicus]MDH6180096.1 putative RecB family nuclease [Antiquaquibacter oligotrophicus]UDF14153.1 TM0106 family RecB-like putative nuclease [Antiquaquibacter oligotrophicus]
MFILDGTVVTSPSDLSLAAKCEFAFVVRLDARLGKNIEVPPEKNDPIQERAKTLGDDHESRHLTRYREQFGEHGVAELARPSTTRDALTEAAAHTLDALQRRVPVVAQATFFDGEFVGFADFLLLQPDGRYRVQDTKLARSAKVTALLQLAAYHAQLERLRIPVDDTVELLLGTDEPSRHHIDDIAPVYRNRRQRLLEIVRERRDDPNPVRWGDPRYVIDGRCEVCEPNVIEHRDLLLVAGIRVSQREKLIDAGITTIDALAATPVRPDGCDVPTRTFAALHEQAALQAHASDDPHAPPPFRLIDGARQVAYLPAADAGDIFFDFEGDPLYSELRDRVPVWNLDYLFGLVDRDENFTAFWAHDLAEEKRALTEFLEWLRQRLEQFPAMHVYHYASYERTHLLSLAARHGVGETFVDQLLRDGVLVDLYPLVRKSVRVGGRSYSIKALEPLYMGERFRADDGVTTAGASVEQYHVFQEAREADAHEVAQRILAEIADYNEYDCVSTLRLHEWLLARAAENGHHAGSIPPEDLGGQPFEPTELAENLAARGSAARESGDIDSAIAFDLASAAVDYHRRENKSFWWGHYDRLGNEEPEEWLDGRDIFAVESAEVVEPWRLARTASHRKLRLTGEWGPGSKGSARQAFSVYAEPGIPYNDPKTPATYRLAVGVSDVTTWDDGSVTVIETCSGGNEPWDELPLALTPGPPPPIGGLVNAIHEVGAALLDGTAEGSAIQRLLWRQPARSDATADTTDVDRVTAAIRSTSYLAVQGPPGTGKTHLAAHLIRDLVRDGWKIGVVAQSHKVVENVLERVVEEGLPAEIVGKAASEGGDYSNVPFTVIEKDSHRGFATRNTATGYVIGGTQWDFTNLKRFERGQLDLLVIDEAGQFSLASTIAVSVASRRLVLLGDPQQLPQVSQGIHPAPVDQSALGFVADGSAVLPPEYGFFLPESWRMHSAVAGPVSNLAYEGRLRSSPSADARHLAGVAPGLHPVPVAHEGNATHSEEEAARVAELVAEHLGREWFDGRETRALGESDIIVVTPYNAQVELIGNVLAAVGFAGVPVGTVDKFQGQQAAVSIVSLAASSAADVPRGVSFLLGRNRLNVAISRAQWAAYLLYSPGLDHLPLSAEGVAELSRFLRLVNNS